MNKFLKKIKNIIKDILFFRKDFDFFYILDLIITIFIVFLNLILINGLNINFIIKFVILVYAIISSLLFGYVTNRSDNTTFILMITSSLLISLIGIPIYIKIKKDEKIN